MKRRLERIQHDNHDTLRRRIALDHMFAHDHLNKRYQWYTADKSFRDSCRQMWSRQSTNSSRMSHVFLPSLSTPELISPLSIASINNFEDSNDENAAIIDEKIKQDFLQIQPVMLEVTRAPHSSELLRQKHRIEARKLSAEKRQAFIQSTAKNDLRYVDLVDSLQNL